MRLSKLLAALLLLTGCATTSIPRANVPGMVSAPDPRAAEAGAEMLRAGGSAADAALATLVAPARGEDHRGDHQQRREAPEPLSMHEFSSVMET